MAQYNESCACSQQGSPLNSYSSIHTLKHAFQVITRWNYCRLKLYSFHQIDEDS